MVQSFDVSEISSQQGFTLPVFVCAAAIAALRWSSENLHSLESVSVDLLDPAKTVEIPIGQVATLSANSALAIAYSEPGGNLDLTRHTPIWAIVERLVSPESNAKDALALTPAIFFRGGEGVGRILNTQQPAIYRYARRLLEANLSRWLVPGDQIQITVILPKGRSLAERTSNAAFGVVEGLSLLGTSGISQPLSTLEQLEQFRAELKHKASQSDTLVLCVGENGLDLATQMGITRDRLVKTANWLGPLLTEAGVQGVQNLLLFGYHGKLIKLAGGIFHTHHHVADARQEIFVAHGVRVGLAIADLQAILARPTVEAALQYLRQLDATDGTTWVNQIYRAIAQQIDQRVEAYIHTHSERRLQVGSILFDRDRQIIIQSEKGATLLTQVC